MLQDRADEAFFALRERVAREIGWDFLAILDQAYVPLTTALDPGFLQDWLYTGRAFQFNSAPVSAGWVATVREDFGSQTYWRIYLRTRFQDGTQGMPMKELPWDFASRHSGDPRAFEEGGSACTNYPCRLLGGFYQPGGWLMVGRGCLRSAHGALPIPVSAIMNTSCARAWTGSLPCWKCTLARRSIHLRRSLRRRSHLLSPTHRPTRRRLRIPPISSRLLRHL